MDYPRNMWDIFFRWIQQKIFFHHHQHPKIRTKCVCRCGWAHYRKYRLILHIPWIQAIYHCFYRHFWTASGHQIVYNFGSLLEVCWTKSLPGSFSDSKPYHRTFLVMLLYLKPCLMDFWKPLYVLSLYWDWDHGLYHWCSYRVSGHLFLECFWCRIHWEWNSGHGDWNWDLLSLI